MGVGIQGQRVAEKCENDYALKARTRGRVRVAWRAEQCEHDDTHRPDVGGGGPGEARHDLGRRVAGGAWMGLGVGLGGGLGLGTGLRLELGLELGLGLGLGLG